MPRRNGGSRDQAPFAVRRTTLLPSSLRDELVSLGRLEGNSAGGSRSHSTSVLGRKERRKAQRNGSKPHANGKPAAAAKSTAPKVDVKGKKRAVEPEPQAEQAGKKRKRTSTSNDDDEQRQQKPARTQATKVDADKRTPLQKLLEKHEAGSSKSNGRGRPVKPAGLRSAAEDDEDAEIAWLEYKLGMTGRKEIQEDGLDDLLGDLDRLDEDLFGEGADSEGEAEDDGDDDEDMDAQEDDADSAGMEEPEEEDDQIESEAELEDFFTDEDADDNAEASAGQDEDTWEGIEGSASISNAAPIDPQPSTSGSRYVPPALRKKQEAATAAAAQPAHDPALRRQLLGLLNRLSPTSFPALVLSPSDPSSLHSIYLAQSRAVINTLLSSLILEIVLAQGDGLGETQAVVLAGLVKLLGTGLVGGMSASGGKEVAASVLDSIIKALDSETVKQDEGEEGKKRLNLIGFLAELYNMQVVSAGLVYDIVREIIGAGLKEGDVEALLRILRQSGPQLRHDDPTALKQIIGLVQDQQKAIPPAQLSVRTKFMIETLTNLRNNKVKPPTGVAAEAEANLKRYVNNLAKKNSASVDPLRISLADLRASESKGKWWVVGAAWSGNPLVDKQDEMQGALGRREPADAASGKEAMLLKLAKKQGMNTDVRRRIFVAVMSSEDYVDAVDKLLNLKLSEVQQRDVVRVLLHCIGSEKAYNPYYTLILARLLTSAVGKAGTHSFMITLQYSLWDYFRSLGETDVGGADVARGAQADADEAGNKKKMRNMAKAYAWWCAKSGLGLNILKPLPFPTLRQPSRTFLAYFLASLFTATQTSSPLLALPSNSATSHPSELESIFVALAASHPAVAQAIEWFLGTSKEVKKECGKSDVLEWARETAIEAINAATR